MMFKQSRFQQKWMKKLFSTIVVALLAAVAVPRYSKGDRSRHYALGKLLVVIFEKCLHLKL